MALGVSAIPKSYSLLFDLELDDIEHSLSVQLDPAPLQAAKKLETCLRPPTSRHRQLVNTAWKARAEASTSDGSVDLEVFARILLGHGYFVWLRTGRGDNQDQWKALRHTFVVCALPDASGSDVYYILDPNFKESFRLPQLATTPRYEAVLQLLPELFVGDRDALVAVVEVMCEEMQQVFAESVGPMPPWRQPRALLTKWLPSKAVDVEVSP